MPLGRIDPETTANVGTIEGGIATNIIPERVQIQAEARSRDPHKLELQTAIMVRALRQAAESMGGTVDVQVSRSYDGYALGADSPIVQLVERAFASFGVASYLEPAGGASDANVFNGHGIATVDLGGGVYQPHTNAEHIAVSDLVKSSQVVEALLTLRPW
jgi:tripeptide aminopeptidase